MVQETVTEPCDELKDENWLTDAHDAEVGMELVFADGGNVERVPIDRVETEGHGVVFYYCPSADNGLSITASEVNERDDVVVV